MRYPHGRHQSTNGGFSFPAYVFSFGFVCFFFFGGGGGGGRVVLLGPWHEHFAKMKLLSNVTVQTYSCIEFNCS